MRSPFKGRELYICDLRSMNEHMLSKFRELIEYLRGKKNNPARVNKKCFKKITSGKLGMHSGKKGNL